MCRLGGTIICPLDPLSSAEVTRPDCSSRVHLADGREKRAVVRRIEMTYCARRKSSMHSDPHATAARAELQPGRGRHSTNSDGNAHLQEGTFRHAVAGHGLPAVAVPACSLLLWSWRNAGSRSGPHSRIVHTDLPAVLPALLSLCTCRRGDGHIMVAALRRPCQRRCPRLGIPLHCTGAGQGGADKVDTAPAAPQPSGRDEAARSVGYRDWFALAVATSEMDETRLFGALDECDRLTADALRGAWKAETDARLAEHFGCAVEPSCGRGPARTPSSRRYCGRRVDLAHVYAGKDVVALARATYDGLGVDTGPILDRSDLSRATGNASTRSASMSIATATSACWPRGGRPLLDGHDAPRARAGAYDIGFDRRLPWLLRDCHLTVTEGIAILMGRRGRTPSGSGTWPASRRRGRVARSACAPPRPRSCSSSRAGSSL